MWPGFLRLLSLALAAQKILAEGATATSSTSAAIVGTNVAARTPGTLEIYNAGTVTVYIAGGGRSATAASFPLAPGQPWTKTLEDVTSVNVYSASAGSVGWIVSQGAT